MPQAVYCQEVMRLVADLARMDKLRDRDPSR
jgi:hypothetical protein